MFCSLFFSHANDLPYPEGDTKTQVVSQVQSPGALGDALWRLYLSFTPLDGVSLDPLIYGFKRQMICIPLILHGTGTKTGYRVTNLIQKGEEWEIHHRFKKWLLTILKSPRRDLLRVPSL